MRGKKREARHPWEPQPDPGIERVLRYVERRWEAGVEPPDVIARERRLAALVFGALDETRVAAAWAWYHHGSSVAAFLTALSERGVEAVVQVTAKAKPVGLGYRHRASGLVFWAREVGVSLRQLRPRLRDEDASAWTAAVEAGKPWQAQDLTDHLWRCWREAAKPSPTAPTGTLASAR